MVFTFPPDWGLPTVGPFALKLLAGYSAHHGGALEGRRRELTSRCWREAAGAQGGNLITGDQIKTSRKLLGWHRGMVAIKARGITGNTVAKAEGAYPGNAPTPGQLAEIQACSKPPASSSRTASSRE